MNAGNAPAAVSKTRGQHTRGPKGTASVRRSRANKLRRLVAVARLVAAAERAPGGGGRFGEIESRRGVVDKGGRKKETPTAPEGKEAVLWLLRVKAGLRASEPSVIDAAAGADECQPFRREIYRLRHKRARFSAEAPYRRNRLGEC
jgi:hypothetical protein